MDLLKAFGGDGLLRSAQIYKMSAQATGVEADPAAAPGPAGMALLAGVRRVKIQELMMRSLQPVLMRP